MTAHIVTGPVAVIKTEGGSERYLYRGAIFDEGYTEESIQHLLGLGLIEEFIAPEVIVVVDPQVEFDARVQEAAEKLLADRAASTPPATPVTPELSKAPAAPAAAPEPAKAPAAQKTATK